MKMTKLKLLLLGMFISTCLNSAAADNKQNMPGFSSLELTEISLDQLMNCLEYTINGITLRVIWTPYGAYYFWTPNVTHRSPDMVSMSHPELDVMPYKELNELFGHTYAKTAERIFTEAVGTIFGNDKTEIGGGRYQYSVWGEHQSVQFDESTVVGNPTAMMIDAFTFNGLNLPAQNNSPKQSIKPGEVGDFLTAWKDSNGNTEWPQAFNQVMNYDQVMYYMANSVVVENIKNLMRQLDAALSSIRGKVGDSPFCPVNATPFEPYYLSGIDVYLWRMGYPTADAKQAQIILNPLSQDIVAPGSSEFTVPTLAPTNALLLERWGHIYPREGALNQMNTAKLGAVIAARSRSLLSESEKPAGRFYRKPKYNVGSTGWGKVFPDKSNQCHLNIANTGTTIQENGMYAWNMWTNHTCDLFRVGVPIAFVPIGPIYVTPQIPE